MLSLRTSTGPESLVDSLVERGRPNAKPRTTSSPMMMRAATDYE
jgi:hypothetical protein